MHEITGNPENQRTRWVNRRHGLFSVNLGFDILPIDDRGDLSSGGITGGPNIGFLSFFTDHEPRSRPVRVSRAGKLPETDNTETSTCQLTWVVAKQ